MAPQPGGVNMRTATVNAVDAQTGQKENGEVYINSKDVGPTGKQIRYSCPAPLLPKLDQDSEPGVQQPGIGPTRKIVRPNVKPVIPPCNGLVELTGYEDAPFDLSRLMQP